MFKTTIGLALLYSVSSLAGGLEVKECYTRLYSDAHLAKNPSQDVREIKFALLKDGFSKALYTMVSFRTKDGDGAFVATAGGSCRFEKRKSTYRCSVDGDGGKFTVVLDKQKAKLIINSAIVAEGVDTFSEETDSLILKPGNANGIFQLGLSRSEACAEM